ncbi:class I adenylate-forming enzyme family protein [Natronomonas halophila]|uniref:class I adenylate-forming enzyme family protein n=1 Tax=Natronomonas halophila TaxID=2747817 RepID=UPI001BA7BD25|nr:class I adenylate-forming enzyme family protein [Natronomonas halophila]
MPTQPPTIQELRTHGDTLVSLLERSAETTPSASAVRCEGKTVTYGTLHNRATSLADGLHEYGLDEDDRCCLCLPNGIPFIEAAWACASGGIVASPINPSYQRREIAYQLDHADAAAIIISPDSVDHARDAIDDVDRDVALFSTEQDDGVDATIDELIEAGDHCTVERSPSDVVFQPYTSGTTGDPKGVLLTNRNFRVQILQTVARRLRQDELGDALVILPTYHITGFLLAVSALAAGQTLNLCRPDQWDPETVLELVTEEPIEEFVGVATMFTDLLDEYDETRHDVSSLQATQQGGTKIPPELQASFEETFNVEIMEGYGMTETTAAVLSSIDASLGNRRGAAGQPTGHTRVKIVDEDGTELPDGEAGELLVKGPQVMAGYYEDGEATEEAFTEDGYLKTGDLASRDADNYVTIKGRKKNTIITGGFNVYPAEVEDTICSHPDVRDAVVVGIPDERKGEVVATLVTPKEGKILDEDEITSYVLDELAPYKHPRIVEIREEAPRTGSGKIKRSVVESQFRERYDSR